MTVAHTKREGRKRRRGTEVWGAKARWKRIGRERDRSYKGRRRTKREMGEKRCERGWVLWVGSQKGFPVGTTGEIGGRNMQLFGREKNQVQKTRQRSPVLREGKGVVREKTQNLMPC